MCLSCSRRKAWTRPRSSSPDDGSGVTIRQMVTCRFGRTRTLVEREGVDGAAPPDFSSDQLLSRTRHVHMHNEIPIMVSKRGGPA